MAGGLVVLLALLSNSHAEPPQQPGTPHLLRRARRLQEEDLLYADEVYMQASAEYEKLVRSEVVRSREPRTQTSLTFRPNGEPQVVPADKYRHPGNVLALDFRSVPIEVKPCMVAF